MHFCIPVCLNSNSVVPQVPGFCLPKFTKWASEMILASPDRDKTSFFKCKFPDDMACPFAHIVLEDSQSYVLSVADKSRIERTTEEDPEKSFSIHWPSYLLALMLGPEHFGLPVGEIFQGDGDHVTTEGLHTYCKKGLNWFSYLLPPPHPNAGLCSKSTCFIVLLLFLLFPELMFVPAFNRGGSDWTRAPATRTESGEILVGHYPIDGTFALIYCRNRDNQRSLRRCMRALFPEIIFFGSIEGLALDCTASRVHHIEIRNVKKGKYDPQSDDGSDDETEQDSEDSEAELAHALDILREAGFDM